MSEGHLGPGYRRFRELAGGESGGSIVNEWRTAAKGPT